MPTTAPHLRGLSYLCRPGAFDAGTAAAPDYSEALGLILQDHRGVQSQREHGAGAQPAQPLSDPPVR